MGNSKSRLRKALLFLDTTDRVPVSTGVVEQIDIAAVEAEAVGVVAVRSRRPIVTVVASIVAIAVGVVAVTGSREKQLLKFLFPEGL
jgi:hypothetical protein